MVSIARHQSTLCEQMNDPTDIPWAICQHTWHEIHGHTEVHVAVAYSQSPTYRRHRTSDQTQTNVHSTCNERTRVDRPHALSSHVAVCRWVARLSSTRPTKHKAKINITYTNLIFVYQTALRYMTIHQTKPKLQLFRNTQTNNYA